MIGSQKHIINKVIVDVEAKSEGAAFRLKDTIDVFLKEEVFPSLECYFESLEQELQSQTIQISQVTLDVKSTSDHDFKNLKEAIKDQAKKELQKIIKTSKNKNVVVLNSNQSKERALIYFLEKGIPPWWNGAKNDDFLQEKAIVEVSNSTSFTQIFRKKLERVEVQDRLINQFSDTQIQHVLYNTFKKDSIKIVILENEIVEKFKELKPSLRKLLWAKYIHYFLKKEEITFLTQLLQLLPSDLERKNQIVTSESLLKIIELIVFQFDEILSKENGLQAFDLKGDYHDKFLGKHDTVQKDNIDVNEGGVHKTKSSIDIESVSEVTSREDLERILKNSEPSNSIEIKEQFEEEERSLLERENEPKFISKDQLKSYSEKESNEKAALTEIKKESSNLESREVLQDGVDSKTTNTELGQKIPKEIRLKDESSSEEESKFQSKKDVEFSEELTTKSISEIDVTIEEITEKVQSKKEVFDHKSTKQNTPPKEKNVFQKGKEILKVNSEATVEKQMKEEFSTTSQTKKENRLKEEFIDEITSERSIQHEEKGEYYVENAGLMILHPYLKDFLINCNLLNAENKITNPELAIHLLHYVATKKEKQFESNMVFGKFLCGFPIQKSIRREVSISKELKQKTEDLLQAIIANWSALNNASNDLLRNEFLQRSGKISFKEDNPKIVVERKVHDILLDKIPWTLSICKLPWMNKLIFTDW
ncbi:MAG: hypothetical protein JXR05_08320 [Flavobacteriaceae bacterium]